MKTVIIVRKKKNRKNSYIRSRDVGKKKLYINKEFNAHMRDSTI